MEPALADMQLARRGGRAWHARASGALIAVLFVAATVGLTFINARNLPSPGVQLARIRNFMDSQRTAMFVTSTAAPDGSNGGTPGQPSGDRPSRMGELELPGQSHWIDDTGAGSTTETVVTGPLMYFRSATNRTELAKAQWIREQRILFGGEFRPSDAPGIRRLSPGPAVSDTLSPAVSDTLSPAVSDSVPPDTASPGAILPRLDSLLRDLTAPSELRPLLGHLTNLIRIDASTIEGTVDTTRLRQAIELSLLGAAEGAQKYLDLIPSPTITMRLKSAGEGRLDQLTVDTSVKPSANTPASLGSFNLANLAYTARTVTTFTDWGKHLTITVPESAIDLTPGATIPSGPPN